MERTAVVLGGSLAGTSAAAVLARHFSKVVVVERDALSIDPDAATPRKGVPQGRHNHNLSPRATAMIQRLFPRALDALRARGATLADVGSEGHWIVQGTRFARATTNAAHLLVTRPTLDASLLRELRSAPNVEIVDRTDACGLVTSDGRVRGVRALSRDDGLERTLHAELVVDASGRGSRLPRWLAEHGFEAPREESVDVKVTYATRLFRRRPTDLGGDRYVFVSSVAPSLPRGGVAFAVEGDRWMVLLFGYGDPRPPLDLPGFIAFANDLSVPDVGRLVSEAEPLDDGAPYVFPKSIRRHYDRTRLPRGLAVIGDALSSTNPSWGLGVTSLAMQIEALEAHLPRTLDTSRLQRELASAASTIWNDVAANDLALDVVPGTPPLPRRILQSIVLHAMRAAEDDAATSAALLRVIGYSGSPLAVLRPDRLLRGWLRTPPRLAPS